MSSRCQKPMIIRNKLTGGSSQVPCGRCENCRKRRISQWSYRLMQEDKVSSSSYFLTLTYDTDSVPVTRNGFMELRSRDLQLFFKRLRKQHQDVARSLKYYAVGEYGGRFKRPHYHVFLFNARLETLIGSKMAKAVKRGEIQLDGKRAFMCDAWSPYDKPIGHITVGKVEAASIGYCFKYMMKDWRPMHQNDDRSPVFSRMSKGLGISYLTDCMVRWHNADIEGRQYCVREGGEKVSLPRYYKIKLMSEEERWTLSLFETLFHNEKENLEPLEYENTAKDRMEAYFAGLRRLEKQFSKNQKF